MSDKLNVAITKNDQALLLTGLGMILSKVQTTGATLLGETITEEDLARAGLAVVTEVEADKPRVTFGSESHSINVYGKDPGADLTDRERLIIAGALGGLIFLEESGQFTPRMAEGGPITRHDLHVISEKLGLID